MATRRRRTEAAIAFEAREKLYTAVASNDVATIEAYFAQDHVRATVAATEAYVAAHKPLPISFQMRVDGRNVYPWYFQRPGAESLNRVKFIFHHATDNGAYEVLAWFFAPQRVEFMGEVLTHALSLIARCALDANDVEMLQLVLTSAVALQDDARLQSLLAETLSFYARGISDDMIQLLIAHGAQINTVSSVGTEQQVDLLVAEGVFITGARALPSWVRSENVAATRRLLQHGVDLENDSGEPLLTAAVLARRNLVELYLVEGYADVDSRNSEGQTALMLAVSRPARAMGDSGNNPFFVVQVLLKAGADVSLRDSEGRTALHHAVRTEHTAVVEILLHHGANPNARADSGGLVLDGVRVLENSGVFLVRLEQLLRYGADPFLQGEHGISTVDRLKHSAVFRTFMETHTQFFLKR